MIEGFKCSFCEKYHETIPLDYGMTKPKNGAFPNYSKPQEDLLPVNKRERIRKKKMREKKFNHR